LTRDRLTGLVALIVGVIYFFATLKLPDSAVADPIGPRAFPFIIAVCLTFVGLLLVLKNEKLTEKNRAVIFTWATDKEVVLSIAYTCVAGLIFGLILEPLGYLISAMLFMTAMMFITYGRSRFLFNIAIGLAFAASTYGLFFMLLEVSLPRGILAF
jgi:putative tricarboxylic transport membrane protein